MSDRIVVACPNCSGRFAVSDESKLGKKIRCPKCSKIFIAKASKTSDSKQATKSRSKPSKEHDGDFEVDEMEDDLDVESRPARVENEGAKKKGKRQPQGGNQLPLIIGGLAGAFLLIAVLVFFMFRGTGEQPEIAKGGIAEGQTQGHVLSGLTNNLGQTIPGSAAGIPDWVGQGTGEPFDVRAFLVSRAAPVDNAAPDYLLALADLHPSMDFAYPPAEWQKRLPAVKELQHAIEQTADIKRLRSGAIPMTEVDRTLALARPTLDKFIQAQKKPNCVFDTGMQFDSIPPYIQSARNFGRLCLVEFFSARSKGDYAAAHQTLARALRLSRDLRPRGMLLVQLAANAFDDLIATAISEMILSQRGLTVDHCDQLIGLLMEHHQKRLDLLQDGLRMEYIMTRNTLIDLKSGRLGLPKLIEMVGNGEGAREFTPQQLAQLNWDAERAACNEIYLAALSHADRSANDLPNAWAISPSGQVLPEPSNLLGLFTPSLNTGYVIAWRERTRLSLLIGLTAVRRYQLAHNALSPDLATAVHEAKISIPLTDWFSGRAVLYSVENNRPIVYSIGSDRTDQGGKVDWDVGKKPGDFVLTIKD